MEETKPTVDEATVKDMAAISLVGAMQMLIADCEAKGLSYSSVSAAAESLWSLRNDGKSVYDIGRKVEDKDA